MEGRINIVKWMNEGGVKGGGEYCMYTTGWNGWKEDDRRVEAGMAGVAQGLIIAYLSAVGVS